MKNISNKTYNVYFITIMANNILIINYHNVWNYMRSIVASEKW